MKWRIIMTDTESPTGMAPVCDKPDVHAMMYGERPDALDVYDCCPHPHIETYGESDARTLVDALNAVADGEGAEMCS
jgi:hypothetical protein